MIAVITINILLCVFEPCDIFQAFVDFGDKTEIKLEGSGTSSVVALTNQSNIIKPKNKKWFVKGRFVYRVDILASSTRRMTGHRRRTKSDTCTSGELFKKGGCTIGHFSFSNNIKNITKNK